MTAGLEPQSRRKFDDLSWKVLGWLMDVMAVGLIAFSVNLHLRITDLELWQSATVANHFTAKDHLTYASQQSVELNRLWLKIADMQACWLKDISDVKTSIAVVPQLLSSPPQWWLEYAKPVIEDHGARIRILENEKRKGDPK